MKLKLIVFTLFSILLCSQTYAQPEAPEGMKWEAVEELTDDFDKWDKKKWRKSTWNYPPPVNMKEKNTGVADGKLWIKATLGKDSVRWFESCRVMSNQEIRFPMYTECSMITAHISAFNTYWLNNGNSKNRDEIDICENVSNPAKEKMADWKYTMHSQYFIVKNDSVERAKGNFDNRNLSDDNPMKGVKWNEKYHTLGMWWKDEYNIQFYINGEEAGSVTTVQPFTRTQAIIWDLWTSPEDWFCGMPEKEDLLDDTINTMYVDWIKTYKLVPAGE